MHVAWTNTDTSTFNMFKHLTIYSLSMYKQLTFTTHSTPYTHIKTFPFTLNNSEHKYVIHVYMNFLSLALA